MKIILKCQAEATLTSAAAFQYKIVESKITKQQQFKLSITLSRAVV